MKKLLVLIVMALFLIGCQSEEVKQETPSEQIIGVEETIEIQPGEVFVDEEVIIPAHEPEPVIEEPEPEPEPQGDIITGHRDSKHFLHGRPDSGAVLSEAPRKVNLVFSYPILDGTEIEVWDEAREVRYHKAEDTVIATDDSLVAIAYLDDMGPGVYKVEYIVEFVTEKEGFDSGHYYFRIE